MFKAADPNGDGHVSVQEGTDILIKKFPLMKPEVLQKIAKRSGGFFFVTCLLSIQWMLTIKHRG